MEQTAEALPPVDGVADVVELGVDLDRSDRNGLGDGFRLIEFLVALFQLLVQLGNGAVRGRNLAQELVL